jgi:hypothetical protein
MVILGRNLALACVAAIIVPAALTFAGCSRVIETGAIDLKASNGEPKCVSALGHYFLPKALLSVVATADQGAGTQTATWAVETHADHSHAFCLDYLSSPTSIDIVTVDRTNEGLLTSINSNVEDRTPAIVQSLVSTAENLTIAAARAGQTPTSQVDSLAFQFDPFDWSDLMLAKAELRRFDLCIYVEGFSFSTEGMDAAHIRSAADHWCSLDAHATPRYDPRLYTFASQPIPPEVTSSGILYRPLATHRIVMLHRKGNTWELYRSKRFDMPNASPVLAIGIERAVFTKRLTSVKFYNGSLTDISVDKSSELEGFVQIPLVVAQAVVDIPAQIVSIRLSDTQSHVALIQAQGNLLNATAEYAKLIGATNSSSPGAREGQISDAARSGETLWNCLNAGGGQACTNLTSSQR